MAKPTTIKKLAAVLTGIAILSIPGSTALAQNDAMYASDRFTISLLEEYGLSDLTKVQDAEPLANIPQVWTGRLGRCRVTLTVTYTASLHDMRFAGSNEAITDRTAAEHQRCTG